METFYLCLTIYIAVVLIHGFYRAGLEIGFAKGETVRTLQPERPKVFRLYIDRTVSDLDMVRANSGIDVLTHTRNMLIATLLNEIERHIVIQQRRDPQMNGRNLRAEIWLAEQTTNQGGEQW